MHLGNPASSKTKLLARLLHLNLRSTDEKAYFSANRFSVMLVDTPHLGGRAAMDRLSIVFANRGLSVEMKLKVYQPSEPDSPNEDKARNGHYSRASLPWDGSGDDRDGSSKLATVAVSNARVDWLEASNTTATRSTQVDRRRLLSDGEWERESEHENEVTFGNEPISKCRTVSSLIKRGVDVVGASVGLICVGPLLLGVMAIIRLTSPGPAIFCQTREGLRGEPFTIYKLRTMVVNAESSQASLRELSHRDGPAFKIKSDPRVTKFGRILRATCADELPQLINVLRGDMSIVGPRPLPLNESRACDSWHRRRLDVRPGLTCYWQINKNCVDNFDDWMRLDLAYVDRRNLWIDAMLIYRTVSVALMGRGSH